MTTKMLVAAAALAAVIGSPALAQTAGQQAPGAQQSTGQSSGQARATREQPLAEDIQTDGRRHSSNQANDVYVSGKYLGSDPDPNIRSDLRRDLEPTGN